MSYMDYSSAATIQRSGQRAFMMGIKRSENPVSNRTNANGVIHWDNGWLKQSKITCKGIRSSDDVYSGCTQTGGDCPECSL